MASRTLAAGVLTALQQPNVDARWFYEGAFEDGVGGIDYLRLWTGVAPISWNGQTWLAAGRLLGIGAISEGSELRADGFTVTLTGDQALLALNLGFARQGLPGRVWLAAFNTATGALTADPDKPAFDGLFDVPEVLDEGARIVITAKYESEFIDLDRAPKGRYTDEAQQALHTGDRGFQDVISLQTRDITWGRPHTIVVSAS